MQLQKVFITWFCVAYFGEKSVYLGGAIPDKIKSCVKVWGGHTSSQRLLKCFHEEADDCMLINVNHAVRVKNFWNVIVSSPAIDVLVNLLYHFTHWIYDYVEQLWMIFGKKIIQNAIPIHILGKGLDGNIIEIFPASHSCTNRLVNFI